MMTRMADPRPESLSSVSPCAKPSCDWTGVTAEEGVLGVVRAVSVVAGDMGGGRGGLTRAGLSGVEDGGGVWEPALGGILVDYGWMCVLVFWFVWMD